jgi:hypothetical protein
VVPVVQVDLQVVEYQAHFQISLAAEEAEAGAATAVAVAELIGPQEFQGLVLLVV